MARALTPRGTSGSLARFVDTGIVGAAEVHAARLIAEATTGSETTSDDALLALVFAVWAMNRGHVCVNLDALQEQVVAEVAPFATEERLAEIADLPWPDPNTLADAIKRADLVGPASETPDTTRPLVLSDRRLFLTRQWVDEGIVAGLLAERLLEPERDIHPMSESWITAAIPGATDDDRQALAVRTILRHSTLLLLGGPGTGKTHTIAAILHALSEERAAGGEPGHLRVAIAAPTAKAAQQVTSAIVEKFRPDAPGSFPSTHKDQIVGWANEADTVHRLLGVHRGNMVRFRHDARNPLPYDVIVIDEVSMVSLPLMARLLEAVPHGARLILVGDPQQLQSIETGAVLAQLEQLRNEQPQIVTLTENHRQVELDDDGRRIVDEHGKGVLNDIGTLADTIRKVATSHAESGAGADPAAVERVLELLGSHRSSTGHDRDVPSLIAWIPIDDKRKPTDDLIFDRVTPDFAAFRDAAETARIPATDETDARRRADTALDLLSRVRVLCGHREGPWGVSGWNDRVGTHVGLDQGLFAPGRPLLVTRNDRAVGVNNGDNGIVVGRDRTRAAFRLHKPGAGADDLPDLLDPVSLSNLETAFAMTVHKSQGSQYETVVFVVPPIGSPLLQLELFYTAVTRAKERLVIIGSEEAIRQALLTPVRRASGLADRIRSVMTAMQG